MKDTGIMIWNDTLEYFADKYGRDSREYKHMKRGAVKALNTGAPYGGGVREPYAREAYALTESPRERLDNDGDGWIQYGYIDGVGMSDDEIREYLDEYVRVRPPYSPYDCTGRAFTWLLDWHRNPSGLISYINHMTLDL